MLVAILYFIPFGSKTRVSRYLSNENPGFESLTVNLLVLHYTYVFRFISNVNVILISIGGQINNESFLWGRGDERRGVD